MTAPVGTHSARGCDECRHTGFRGRTGIYEIMVMDEHMRRLVRDDVEPDALRAAALAHGMRSLRLSGAGKVAAGLTTIEEVMKVIQTDRVGSQAVQNKPGLASDTLSNHPESR